MYGQGACCTGQEQGQAANGSLLSVTCGEQAF